MVGEAPTLSYQGTLPVFVAYSLARSDSSARSLEDQFVYGRTSFHTNQCSFNVFGTRREYKAKNGGLAPRQTSG